MLLLEILGATDRKNSEEDPYIQNCGKNRRLFAERTQMILSL